MALTGRLGTADQAAVPLVGDLSNTL